MEVDCRKNRGGGIVNFWKSEVGRTVSRVAIGKMLSVWSRPELSCKVDLADLVMNGVL